MRLIRRGSVSALALRPVIRARCERLRSRRASGQRELDHPRGHVQWPAVRVAGSPAGNTAFPVGRSVGIGKIFTFVDVETGLVIERTVNGGQRLDPTCEFVFEDVPVPGLPGLRDVRFIVQGLTTPQGPQAGRPHRRTGKGGARLERATSCL